ncbi:hypothetical protein [Helicobacter zhangjianzhongii]|uniref:Uncharacterized protein n=1 Tax=Helicobacter zhangjianzhongii TaxID=2974574 RepID=A0ACC6FSC7_9HELI|nr:MULTISPECIES: hypothetical protein [unclassified Helicobacter]MDL0079769.1 hypothetical protein [Helicobacter sp. CPD2-1]MDL0082136.1 hypothetical protein [Helicobacter sp. XJK30-2]
MDYHTEITLAMHNDEKVDSSLESMPSPLESTLPRSISFKPD